MLNIGLADYYLDNWHANHYPQFLREAAARWGYDVKIAQAFGILDRPPQGGRPPKGGLSTREWCRERNIAPAGSMEELVGSVDAIMVIAADDSSWHEQVAELPLKSGKPVFVDKTFAHSLAAGKRMFALAEEHHTPVFTASAQRYCQDILDWQKEHAGWRGQPEGPRFVSTVGPHSLDNYAVHQLEPILALMGPGVKRLKAFAVGSAVTQLILDYGDGRLASFMQTPQPWAEFNFMVSDGETGKRLISDDGSFYHHLMKAILDFFVHGICPVAKEETLEILAMIDTAREARRHPDTWFPIAY